MLGPSFGAVAGFAPKEKDGVDGLGVLADCEAEAAVEPAAPPKLKEGGAPAAELSVLGAPNLKLGVLPPPEGVLLPACWLVLRLLPLAPKEKLGFEEVPEDAALEPPKLKDGWVGWVDVAAPVGADELAGAVDGVLPPKANLAGSADAGAGAGAVGLDCSAGLPAPIENFGIGASTAGFAALSAGCEPKENDGVDEPDALAEGADSAGLGAACAPNEKEGAELTGAGCVAAPAAFSSWPLAGRGAKGDFAAGG